MRILTFLRCLSTLLVIFYKWVGQGPQEGSGFRAWKWGFRTHYSHASLALTCLALRLQQGDCHKRARCQNPTWDSIASFLLRAAGSSCGYSLCVQHNISLGVWNSLLASSGRLVSKAVMMRIPSVYTNIGCKPQAFKKHTCVLELRVRALFFVIDQVFLIQHKDQRAQNNNNSCSWRLRACVPDTLHIAAGRTDSKTTPTIKV